MLDGQLEEFAKNETRAETVKRTEESLFELYKDPNLDHKPEELTKRGGAHYSDAACDLIMSIHNDLRMMMVVSTVNNGTITDLPNDSVVETSAIITSHGPEPLAWGGFESSIRGTLQLQKAMEEVVIEAAVTGCYNTALQAFTMNPVISSGSKAKAMLDEMLIENRDYLPQFKEVIKELMAK
jgi:6-phospho-beta-glucosidase